MNLPNTNCACGHRNRRSFTLVELLVVMVIIMILAGLIVGGAGMVSRKNTEAKTKAQMHILEVALEQYRQEFGYFPISNSPQILTQNMIEGVVDGSTRYHGLEKPSGTTAPGKYYVPTGTFQYGTDSSSGLLCAIDAFLNPYHYLCPGTHHPQAYDLWSCGADKASGTTAEQVDDLTNWQKN